MVEAFKKAKALKKTYYTIKMPERSETLISQMPS